MEHADVVIIGGGIAGVSVGHFLSRAGARVVLVEAEPQLAYHTTGRSAALLFENYGHLALRPLSRASRSFLENPPTELTEASLVGERRGVLMVARPDQLDHLAQLEREGRESGTVVHLLGPAEARTIVPVLDAEALAAALWEPDACDLDVAALHQAFVRGIRRGGGTILTRAPVTALGRSGDRWTVATPVTTLGAAVVVNAAGAWGDLVAGLAGVAPVGLVPMRRTAFMAPGDPGYATWPLVVGAEHDYYFKPDGVQLLCSLAEETPSLPCDARPEEIDVALAIERINRATTLGIRTVRSAWAGLRTFAPDRSMVIGFEPTAPGLFWMVGHGGTGIQTAPAAGMLAAGLILDGTCPPALVEDGLDTADFAPSRFR